MNRYNNYNETYDLLDSIKLYLIKNLPDKGLLTDRSKNEYKQFNTLDTFNNNFRELKDLTKVFDSTIYKIDNILTDLKDNTLFKQYIDEYINDVKNLKTELNKESININDFHSNIIQLYTITQELFINIYKTSEKPKIFKNSQQNKISELHNLIKPLIPNTFPNGDEEDDTYSPEEVQQLRQEQQHLEPPIIHTSNAIIQRLITCINNYYEQYESVNEELNNIKKKLENNSELKKLIDKYENNTKLYTNISLELPLYNGPVTGTLVGVTLPEKLPEPTDGSESESGSDQLSGYDQLSDFASESGSDTLSDSASESGSYQLSPTSLGRYLKNKTAKLAKAAKLRDKELNKIKERRELKEELKNLSPEELSKKLETDPANIEVINYEIEARKAREEARKAREAKRAAEKAAKEKAAKEKAAAAEKAAKEKAAERERVSAERAVKRAAERAAKREARKTKKTGGLYGSMKVDLKSSEGGNKKTLKKRKLKK